MSSTSESNNKSDVLIMFGLKEDKSSNRVTLFHFSLLFLRGLSAATQTWQSAFCHNTHVTIIKVVHD